MHCWCVLGDNHGQGAGAPHPHIHMLHGWRWSYIYLFRIWTFMKNPPGVVLNLHGVLTDHFETYILFCVSVTCLFCVSVTCSSLVLQSICLPLSWFQIFGTFLKGSSPSHPSIVKMVMQWWSWIWCFSNVIVLLCMISHLWRWMPCPHRGSSLMISFSHISHDMCTAGAPGAGTAAPARSGWW